MNCGMRAVVIAERNSKDVDVQFEDGTIVTHRARTSFLKGSIGNPSLGVRASSHRSILGQTKMMNCGQNATVIADRNAQDIDVQFEDGTIVEHKERGCFRKGAIANPSLGKTYTTHKTRAKNSSILGEKRIMKNGLLAEVIEDKSSSDISVRFEDGTIVYHKSRNSFRLGYIKNPNYDKSNIVNTTVKMRNGLNATCIVYRNSNDIDIRFEDGVIVYHKAKSNFLSGRIAHPNIDSYDQTRQRIVGETRMMNCGMEATVISDRNSRDIDVRFSDGTVVEHRTRTNFRNRTIANPNLLTNSLPEQIVFFFVNKYIKNTKRSFRPRWLRNPETGVPLELDIWIPSKKTGIEYDGALWHSEENDRSRYKCQLIEEAPQIEQVITILEKGAIVHTSNKHLNFQLHYQSTMQEYEKLLSELEGIIRQILLALGIKAEVEINAELIEYLRNTGKYNNKDFEVLEEVRKVTILGQKNIMNCGMEAKCIAYRGTRDIDVQFEDGTIVEHRDKYSFIRGTIANPSLPNHYSRTRKTSILGETRTMNCGMNATVISYERSNELTVQFEDGTVVKHRTKDQFLKGIIANPTLGVGFARRKNSVGETNMMKCGMNATIISYKNYDDIDVQFEDGTIVKNKNKGSFIKGEIRNPNCINPRKTDITGETRIMNCGLKATVIKYNNANDISVRFENGTIVKHKSKDSFQKGAIWCPKNNIN